MVDLALEGRGREGGEGKMKRTGAMPCGPVASSVCLHIFFFAGADGAMGRRVALWGR